MRKETKKIRSKTSDSRERKHEKNFKSRRFGDKSADFSEDRQKRSYRKKSDKIQDNTDTNQDSYIGDDIGKRGSSLSDERARRTYRRRDDDRPRRSGDFGGDDKPRRSYREDNQERRDRRPSYKNRRDDDRPRRSSDFGGDDKPRRSYREDNQERQDRRPSYKNRRDDDRPRRSNDFGCDDKPRRSYREDNQERRDRRPSYKNRRDDDRPRRSSDFGGDDKPRRSYREDNQERRDGRPSYKNRENKPYRQRQDDSIDNARQRRDVTAESEILSEIVEKRHQSGRYTPQRQKLLSLEYEEATGPIRLNKYISNSGICSRRDADILIQTGEILVNGKVVTELGTKIMPTDEVRYQDNILQREKPVYVLLNKPKDFITTMDDERGRKNVMSLVANACRERIYPVGRLDRNTTGLLLFTNDGQMSKKLTHPRYGIKKIYHVELDKAFSGSDFEKMRSGIEIDNEVMIPDDLEYVNIQINKRELGITIHSGKNRVVRRLFESLGYEVVKLDRVYYAGLTKKDLPRGTWRILTQQEINMLKMSI